MITPQDIEDTTIEVNGTKLSAKGVIVESFKVGGAEVKTDAYQGFKRTSFNVLAYEQTMRPITATLFFVATTKNILSKKKSEIDNMLLGKLELKMPDGFYYSSYLESTGELQILGVESEEVIAIATYKFKGIRHEAKETVNGNTVNCKSYVPRTDCKLTCTATADHASLVIDSVTITDVHNGDVLVVDGINGQILQNGAPCAGNMSFIHFPYLVPGANTLTCVETLTVEYYPTY